MIVQEQKKVDCGEAALISLGAGARIIMSDWLILVYQHYLHTIRKQRW